jgi:hypothetical protein
MQSTDSKTISSWLCRVFLSMVLLAPACGQAQPASDMDRARRGADAAGNETRRAESAAQQADRRLKRAEDNLKAAQVELDTSHREVLATQQRLSAARNAENRALRSLDAAQKQAR